jgi:hypothetical protein
MGPTQFGKQAGYRLRKEKEDGGEEEEEEEDA